MQPKFISIRLFVIISVLLTANFLLAQDSIVMQEIIPLEISSEKSLDPNIIELSRKDFLTQPASFDDPSRLVLKYAGHTTQNDQSNFIIKDGLPPQFSDWTINNAKIINPNHLGNAGTVENRYSSSAGGVNIFSGQVIGNYSYKGQPQQSINTTIAGTSDISFRTPYKNQASINLSLLGVEGGLDASYKNKLSGNVNGRYSTVGLLEELGVSFGDESINYGEMFGQIHYRPKSNVSINAFFTGGKSGNTKSGMDSLTASTYNDLLRTDYESELFLGGINYKSITSKTSIEASINYSQRNIHYNSQIRNSFDPGLFLSNKESNLSVYFSKKYNWLKSNFEYQIRSSLNTHSLGFNYIRNNDLVPQNGDFDRLDSELLFLFNHKLSTKLSFTIGTGIDHDSRMQIYNFDHLNVLPTFQVSYTPANSWLIDLSMNHSSQHQEPIFYTLQNGNQLVDSYQSLSPTKGSHSQLQFQQKKWSSSLTLFHHFIYDIPHSTFNPYEYSFLSNFDQFVFQFGTDNISKAISYGAKLQTVQKFFGWKLDFNASAFNFKQYIQTNLRDINFKPAFAYNYVTNVSLLKEDFLTRGLGIGFSLHTRGGMREKKIDLTSSIENGWMTYDLEDPFSISLAPFYRMDMRVNYTFKPRKFFKSMISLDIQNITNHLNDAYHYYDDFTKTVELKKQLGLIPVLSWRVVI